MIVRDSGLLFWATLYILKGTFCVELHTKKQGDRHPPPRQL